MTTEMASEQMLTAVAQGDTPVLETLAQMHLDTLGRSELPEKTYHMVRLAAMVAMDAPPVSYLAHLEMAKDAGVTIHDVQGVLTAIAPMVGGPRVMAAAANAIKAMGMAERLDETMP